MGAFDTVQQNFVGDNPAQSSNPIKLGYTADGPAAAPLVNQLLQNMQDTQDRSMRASDTSNAMNQNVLQNALLNNPNVAASRELDMLSKGVQKEGFDSGMQSKVANSALETAFAKNIADASGEELKTMSNRAQHFVAMESMVGDLSPGDFAGHPGLWKDMKKTGEQLGIKNIPDSPTPDAIARIHAGANVAKENIAAIHKRMEQAQAGDNARTVADITSRPAMIDAGTRAELAKTDPGRYLTLAYMALDKGNPSMGQLQKIHDDIVKATGQFLTNDPGFKIRSSNAAAAESSMLEANKEDFPLAKQKFELATKALKEYVMIGQGKVELAKKGQVFDPDARATQPGGAGGAIGGGTPTPARAAPPRTGQVPKGIPEGSTRAGLSEDGKTVWTAPDGKNWTE